MDAVLQMYMRGIGIEPDDITSYDVRRLMEIIYDTDNKLYCEDSTYHGVYHVYKVSEYSVDTINFKKLGIYHPVYGVLDTPSDVENFEMIDDMHV